MIRTKSALNQENTINFLSIKQLMESILILGFLKVMAKDLMKNSKSLINYTGTTVSQFITTQTETNSSGNHTMIANELLLPDKSNPEESRFHSHRTAMIAIISIFVCISLTITVAVFVFCKKKNSVFILQKSEMESDIDYEMNDMNTEMDTSDSEADLEMTNETRRSQTCPNMSNLLNTHQKLPTILISSDNDDKHEILFVPKSNTFVATTMKKKFNFGKISSPSHTPLFSKHFPERPKSLPISTSFSSTSSCNNYQSMLVTADIEPCLESESSECFNNDEADSIYNDDEEEIKILLDNDDESNFTQSMSMEILTSQMELRPSVCSMDS